MRPTLSVVKIGGNVIEEEAALSEFLDLFSKLPSPAILVHGGGKRATTIGAQLGIEARMIHGRRLTDAPSLEIAIMVYAGLINKNIVASLQARNCNAIGLCGADGNAVFAHKRPVKEVDFGFVGDVDGVNTSLVSKLLQAGLVPVFCALTHDGNGQLLNTNADTIASEIAIGMSEKYNTTLYYCFENQGVLRDLRKPSSVIEAIDSKSFPQLLEAGIIAEGMLPKMENCFHALRRHVGKVCIGNVQMLKPNHTLYTTLTL